ncbi:hypothetical protein RHEC894_CH02737 [Rhizobium sp. CIAT894]|nr:hypothetical protein RHEC894_CH02737 [Rhizobium sp. CIAT894]
MNGFPKGATAPASACHPLKKTAWRHCVGRPEALFFILKHERAVHPQFNLAALGWSRLD